MFDIIARFVLYAIMVLIVSYLLPGVEMEGFLTALIVAAVLSVLNAFVKPFLVLITIPITFATLGLFLLVINAGIILLASAIVPQFHVDGFWWALLFSIIISFFTMLFRNNTQSHFF